MESAEKSKSCGIGCNDMTKPVILLFCLDFLTFPGVKGIGMFPKAANAQCTNTCRSSRTASRGSAQTAGVSQAATSACGSSDASYCKSATLERIGVFLRCSKMPSRAIEQIRASAAPPLLRRRSKHPAVPSITGMIKRVRRGRGSTNKWQKCPSRPRVQ